MLRCLSYPSLEANKTARSRRQRQRQPLLPWPIIPRLDGLEPLHQANGRVARLQQGKLLADADPWSAVEGEVFPA